MAKEITLGQKDAYTALKDEFLKPPELVDMEKATRIDRAIQKARKLNQQHQRDVARLGLVDSGLRLLALVDADGRPVGFTVEQIK